ncbi:hypothetical protein, partial [Pseudomonas monteilii]|uniref:hypothetical protein n=1 Tax=Pseudomonas monteilii TaxID=76759 RepID=UPI0036E6BA2F
SKCQRCADLKPYISSLLRDSAARKGWVISHRYSTWLEVDEVDVGAGLPAMGRNAAPITSKHR